jgi:hypothetical protein
MGRKRIELGNNIDAQIRALAARGGTAQGIADALASSGVKGVSARTIGRRLREARGNTAAPRGGQKRPTAGATSAPAASATVAPPEATAPAAHAEGPATAKDKQVDELIARSRTWRRVEAAIAGSLAAYPEAAAAAVRALRAVSL